MFDIYNPDSQFMYFIQINLKSSNVLEHLAVFIHLFVCFYELSIPTP